MNKKNIAIAVTIIISSGFAVSGCSNIEEPHASIAHESKIKAITIESNVDGIKQYIESDDIKKICDALYNLSEYKKESVSDAPYVNQFTQLTFNTEDDSSVVYYYEDNGQTYLEIPYVGIYQVDPEFESIIR